MRIETTPEPSRHTNFRLALLVSQGWSFLGLVEQSTARKIGLVPNGSEAFKGYTLKWVGACDDPIDLNTDGGSPESFGRGFPDLYSPSLPNE